MFAKTINLIGVVVGIPLSICLAADPTVEPKPADKPAAEVKPADAKPAEPVDQTQRIKELVAQLGHEEYKVRDKAAADLEKIGPAALPALREALKSEDASIKSYAEYLIPRIEPPKAAPRQPRGFDDPVFINPGRNFARQQRVSISVTNGTKLIDVVDDEQHISIREDQAGIAMTITQADKDKKEVTTEYTAKTPAELKQKSPEAFRIYEQYAGRGGAGRVQIRIGGGNGGFEADERAMREQARRQIEAALRNAGFPAEHIKRMLDELDENDRLMPIAPRVRPPVRPPRPQREDDPDVKPDRPAEPPVREAK